MDSNWFINLCFFHCCRPDSRTTKEQPVKDTLNTSVAICFFSAKRSYGRTMVQGIIFKKVCTISGKSFIYIFDVFTAATGGAANVPVSIAEDVTSALSLCSFGDCTDNCCLPAGFTHCYSSNHVGPSSQEKITLSSKIIKGPIM